MSLRLKAVTTRNRDLVAEASLVIDRPMTIEGLLVWSDEKGVRVAWARDAQERLSNHAGQWLARQGRR